MTAALVVAALAAGSLLGLVFFGALWLTAIRVVHAGRPGVLLLASFALRMSVAAIGFYVVAGWGAAYVAIALLAFLTMRTLVVRRATAGARRRDPVGRAGAGVREGDRAPSEVTEPWT